LGFTTLHGTRRYAIPQCLILSLLSDEAETVHAPDYEPRIYDQWRARRPQPPQP
jgi:hypothetical protein